MFRPSSRSSDSASAPLQRRQTVLTITPYYTSHNGPVERVAERLMAEIALEHNVHFTWAASECAHIPEMHGTIALPMQGTNILEKLFGWQWPLWTPRSLQHLYMVMEGVDCVWLHDNETFGSLIAFYMARRLKKPVIFTHHVGLAQTGLIKRFSKKCLGFIMGQRILKDAHQSTFTGDATAEFYYRQIAFTRPVKIIPNGVDTSIFQPTLREKRNVLRSSFALRNEQPVMLFVGRFDKENGLPALKELAKLLPDWRFWLAGTGPIQPEKWFLPNVQVFRHRQNQELAELYQAADLLLQPGPHTTFPLAVQEAMACGLPVMCGKDIASGSLVAKPYLWVVNIDPSPERTAALWAKKLKGARRLWPLTEAKTELSDVAQSFWEWPIIAGHYADILKTYSPQKIKTRVA
ncbi:MAG: glycosyltransferase family 4 protein [Alphaproteobacteria bacterium]